MINEIADWNASSFNRRKTVPNAADQSEDPLFPGSPVNAMVAEDVRGHRSSIYPLIPWSWTNVSTETYLPSFPHIEDEDAQS